MSNADNIPRIQDALAVPCGALVLTMLLSQNFKFSTILIVLSVVAAIGFSTKPTPDSFQKWIAKVFGTEIQKKDGFLAGKLFSAAAKMVDIQAQFKDYGVCILARMDQVVFIGIFNTWYFLFKAK
jgi:hypothetical protein